MCVKPFPFDAASESARTSGQIHMRQTRSFTNTANNLASFLRAVHDILNSNSSIESLNTFTEAFQYTLNSPGWAAVDMLINTMGNSMTIYDIIAGSIERTSNFIRQKQEDREKAMKDADTSEDDFREELTTNLKQVVSQLTSLNKRMKCHFSSLAGGGDDGKSGADCSDIDDDEDEQATSKLDDEAVDEPMKSSYSSEEYNLLYDTEENDLEQKPFVYPNQFMYYPKYPPN